MPGGEGGVGSGGRGLHVSKKRWVIKNGGNEKKKWADTPFHTMICFISLKLAEKVIVEVPMSLAKYVTAF